ncbi:AraC family transcriptional regulator [Pseudonocardia sp.]|uniref:helix-turn-helix transcriptional regulator n=1 Tax=Pseudonocardia sp. TaxID=60912 RepID=UPI0031FDA6EC
MSRSPSPDVSSRPQSFSFHESTIDEAQAAIESTYFIARLDLVEPGAPYEFRFDGISIGALTVGRARYNARIKMMMGEERNCYHINFPTVGSMHTAHRRRSLDVAPGNGVLYEPEGSVHLSTTTDGYDSYPVRIDRHALENSLERLLDHPVTTPLAVDLALDLEHGAGACWSRLVAVLAREASQHDGLLTHPLAAAPLHDAVIYGLLHTAVHRWRDELDAGIRSWAPRPVGRAVEAMHAHPEHPHTPTGLADISGIGVRALHEAFRRQTGMTPMSYLRRLRLQHVHDELRRAQPSGATVTDVAHRWGFSHLSRFAEYYQRRYGQPPSATLRQAVTARDASSTRIS